MSDTEPSMNRQLIEVTTFEEQEEEEAALRASAAKADRAAFLAVLDKAPDLPPLPGKELP